MNQFDPSPELETAFGALAKRIDKQRPLDITNPVPGKPVIDFNQLQPGFDTCGPFPTTYRSGNITCYTAHLAEELSAHIAAADAVVGCMAWLTSRVVLKALSEVQMGCQIVVQKEDFIRPGIVSRGELQNMYSRVRSPGDGYDLPPPGCDLNTCGDASEQVDPIRCLGEVHYDDRKAHPRMHHKFFVFCRRGKQDYRNRIPLIPFAVWTGSFNATENATRSMENAVVIDDTKVAVFYANEWARLYAMSEPLDWKERFMNPEFKRFGT